MDAPKTRIQTRGHCQSCGNQQAVSGVVAKHGYTVRNGWFQGTCPGSNGRPMETERAGTDALCVRILASCEELDQHVAGLKSGAVVLGLVADPLRGSRAPQVEFATLSDYRKEQAVARAIYDAQFRAKTGRAVVEHLQQTADRVHGAPLAEVEVPVKSGPTVHARGGAFGVVCAGSRMGATKARALTDDRAAVTCSRCLADLARRATS